MSNQTSNNNKRIAKNTLFLYFRMLFMMVITLYTNRVVLDKLGITDFGIYNIVGGIVVMLGFLSGCMSNSVQRYFSFEIGRNNKVRLNQLFCASLLVHWLIAAFVLLVMECVGLWYLNTHLNIPADRMSAANWVYQCSLLTMMFTIVQVPYNAMIVSKERMGVYAYISILEAILKLVIVYLLTIGDLDRLKMYAVLTMVVTVGILMIYRVYCRRTFDEVKFRFVKEVSLYKELLGFSGWNMLSEVAWTFTGPGVNLILNIFFGPTVNAAKGLAEQVNGAVSRFVSNFQTAVNPQLIKMYASDEREEMKKLLFRSSRFSYYLMLVLSLPLILKMDYVLHLWLKEVPEYTVIFCQLTLVMSLVSTLSTLLPKIAWATGDIKVYQIIVSFVLILNFPLSFVVLKLGAPPYATSIVAVVVQAIILYVRLFLVCKMVDMNVLQFQRNVIFPAVFVTLVAVIIPLISLKFIGESFGDFILCSLISAASACISSFYVGMTQEERKTVISFIVKLKAKFVSAK